MMTTRIIGTGSALPKKVLSNDELSKIMDTSDEWIRSRTGIVSRHVADQEETAATLAAEAGRRALDNAGMKPEEMELVLVATCSAENYFPSVGCQVQELLGLKNAAAMDISAACSGFLFALNTAHAYILSGLYEKILVIGTETLSRTIDWTDRGTCVLFGDGAGACVVQRDKEGIIGISQHSDGTQGGVLTSFAPRLETPLAAAAPGRPLYMEGQAVFKFAVKTVPECIRQVLDKNHTEVEDVKYFILHQANSRIIQSVAKRLKAAEEKFPINLDKCGNTSAASIPILLDEMNRSNKLEKGDLLVLSGFGAGLTWGAALLRW